MSDLIRRGRRRLRRLVRAPSARLRRRHLQRVRRDIGEHPQREVERLRGEIDEHPERAMVVRPNVASDELFFVFMGKGVAVEMLRNRDVVPSALAGMKPLTFFRETGLTGVNLVMLRDHYRFFYHAGINRDVTDLDGVLRRLRDCRDGMMGVRRSACLGSSSGGYAALLFGHLLAVDTVYAFAPQTRIDPDRLRALSGRDELWRIPDAHRDLSILLSQHNGRTRYEVYYCEENQQDREMAERIGGCPGVHLHPESGSSHFVIPQMHRAGRLPVFVRGTGVSPEGSGSRSG